jgi:Raf kinase inhibitor-like YbhB/YbcL family protein
MKFTLRSESFVDGTEMPVENTADGADRSPPLSWSGAPAGTKSLALIVDDPDAPDPENPRTTWVHWVVVDLPPSAEGIGAGASASTLPKPAREGRNDWKRLGWGGPNPPIGRHRYFHKLYALDTMLPALEHPTKQELERAMKGHVLAEARLVGTYQKRAFAPSAQTH